MSPLAGFAAAIGAGAERSAGRSPGLGGRRDVGAKARPDSGSAGMFTRVAPGPGMRPDPKTDVPPATDSLFQRITRQNVCNKAVGRSAPRLGGREIQVPRARAHRVWTVIRAWIARRVVNKTEAGRRAVNPHAPRELVQLRQSRSVVGHNIWGKQYQEFLFWPRFVPGEVSSQFTYGTQNVRLVEYSHSSSIDNHSR